MRYTLLTLGFVALASSAFACCRPPPPVTAPKPKPTVQEDPEPPPGTLWREDVNAVLDAGMGAFLQRVRVEPALESGRFVGWHLIDLQPPGFWDGVDLQPGDVVVSINGQPIERDYQAFDVFKSLKRASELRVTYFRGPEERELSYQIASKSGKPPPKADAAAKSVEEPIPVKLEGNEEPGSAAGDAADEDQPDKEKDSDED